MKTKSSHDISSGPGEQLAMKTVATCEGQATYFDTGGDKPLIVGLHAVGHSSADFLPLAQRLANSHRVIGVDLPGHGGSQLQNSSKYTSDRLCDFLNSFVQALGLTNFVLIGNSIGGAVAIRFAYQNEQKVRLLVLCNPGGLDKGGLSGRIFIWCMAWIFRQGARGAFWFPRFYRRYYRLLIPARGAEARRAQIVADGPAKAGLLSQAWFGFGQPSEDLRSQFKALKVPTWIAWAKQDRIIQYRRNRAALANQDITFFKSGHVPFLEQPDKFVRELTKKAPS